MKIYGLNNGVNAFPASKCRNGLRWMAKHDVRNTAMTMYLKRRARQDRSFLKEAEIEMSQERQEQAAEDRKLLEEIMQYENSSLGMSDDELNILDARMSRFDVENFPADCYDYPYDSSYDDGDI